MKETGHLARAAPAAMKSAPPSAASNPDIVTPPEVPAARRLPETIETGSPAARVPISVAHVSAADAASAPIPKAYHAGAGETEWANAASTKRPPLASTCQASLSSFFSSIGVRRRAFLRPPIFDNVVAATKCATSSAPQLHPAITATVPARVAAAAPLADSARALRPASATIPAANTPIAARTPSTIRICYPVSDAKRRRAVGSCLKGIRATVSLRSPPTN
jgi:hypothetical protein